MRKCLLAGAALLAGLLSIRASEPLAQDTGVVGTYQKLLKLRTIASVMHTTAHPDDEHGGMLAWLSRGQGARVALMTLNRGQSGDNALGPQLFDGLGLIRTEELVAASRYYGVDAQYFTSVIDYGFSKRLEEAFEKWGREPVLRDVVRIVRLERPLVLVSRFQGTARDGHGNHQAAGVITLQAFQAAGDPRMFPDQIAEGLRPWRPARVFIGGMREDEAWDVRIDSGQYSPWLGMSYGDFARVGLSLQRSQTSGRLVLTPGPQYNYYQRADQGAADRPRVGEARANAGFFDGIDTTITGLFATIGRPEPPGAAARLQPIAQAVEQALRTLSVDAPAATVPALARGLAATRAAIEAFGAEPDAVFILRRKEAQFADAIHTAMGLVLSAVAQPAGAVEPTGPGAGFAPPPVMGPVVPGQAFDVRVTFASRGAPAITLDGVDIEAGPGWAVTPAASAPATPGPNEPVSRRFAVRLAADVPISSKPYFERESFQDARYQLTDPSQFGRPVSAAPAVAVARYRVEGVAVEARETVRRREARLPFGYVLRELRVVPAIAVTTSPATVVVPLGDPRARVRVQVDVLNNRAAGSSGELGLRLPAGWSAEPARVPFTFARGGERATYAFDVAIPAIADRTYRIEAVAASDGQEYAAGYETIEYRDLEARLLYRPAVTDVRGVNVERVPGLDIGYVMGVGDQVPDGIRQLGYTVTLLDEDELGRGDLGRFDAIVTGTRAYAVREDLKTYNRRLLEYVERGGNLIVLYNTQEYVPGQWAPRPGELTARAEEVSEEDSPVDILAADAPVLQWPNRITAADFEGWVEQRGSKFWSSWDPGYQPIIATWDRDQAPQRGGWLSIRHGKGHYTYFAYAMHRQLPYGVPGAYRLMANLLAQGQPRN